MGIVATDDKGLVYRGGYDRRIISIIRSIPGVSGLNYRPESKEWALPPCREVLDFLGPIPEIKISPEARAVIQNRIEAAQVVQAVKQDDEKPEPVRNMPIKMDPFAHQVKGFNVVLALFGWDK